MKEQKKFVAKETPKAELFRLPNDSQFQMNAEETMNPKVIFFSSIFLICGLWLSLPVRAQEPSTSAGQAKNPIGQELAGVKVLRDLEYARAGEKSLLLDLYLPEKAQRPLPLIIWIHGGAWMAG